MITTILINDFFTKLPIINEEDIKLSLLKNNWNKFNILINFLLKKSLYPLEQENLGKGLKALYLLHLLNIQQIFVK